MNWHNQRLRGREIDPFVEFIATRTSYFILIRTVVLVIKLSAKTLSRISLIIILVLLIAVYSGSFKKPVPTIRIGMVDWPEARCMSSLAKLIIEEKMDYRVELLMMNVDHVFQALSLGECDIFMDCWLPITHDNYISQYSGNIENLGPIYEGARTGLIVPSYVTINSIAQLNENKDKFNGTITGVEPEAGIMGTTQKAAQFYHLDYKIDYSSSADMVEKLDKAINHHEWIVVTGWSPHWKFAKWDLKFLDDPLFIYGATENLHVIAQKGFSKKYPDAAAFLSNFSLSKEQLEELMLLHSNSSVNCANTDMEWLRDNIVLVNSWLSVNN